MNELRGVAKNLGLMPTESFDDGTTRVVLYYAYGAHTKNIMPTWDRLQAESEGSNVSVEKIDCEANPEAAEENGVSGFPTIILYKNGKSVTYEGDDH